MKQKKSPSFFCSCYNQSFLCVCKGMTCHTKLKLKTYRAEIYDVRKEKQQHQTNTKINKITLWEKFVSCSVTTTVFIVVTSSMYCNYFQFMCTFWPVWIRNGNPHAKWYKSNGFTWKTTKKPKCDVLALSISVWIVIVNTIQVKEPIWNSWLCG